VNAFERVQERLHRVAAALEAGGVPYAVVGGNAVASWVSRVDETLARATRDVDVLLRREDLARARAVLEDGGFIYRHVAGIDVFLDGPQTKVGDGVHILFATERVRPTDAIAAPDVGDSEEAGRYRVVSLEALVRLKLNAWRRKDQVHLQDLMSVGLIDETWRSRLPPVLGERLQTLLDDPDG
jgi:hypothetical protein